MAKVLTAMQQRFIDAYEGNATQAARAAGYKQPHSQGPRLLENVEIKKAIAERERTKMGGVIAEREDRQKFWTSIMRDENEKIKDRLKASELLGRSQGDFIPREEKPEEPQGRALIINLGGKPKDD